MGGSDYDPPPGAPPTARASRGAPSYQGGPPGSYGPYYREKPYIISAKVGAILALVGVVIVFVGFMVTTTVGYLGYSRHTGDIITTGWILAWVGLMILTFPLFLVGIANEAVEWRLRGTMIAGASGILIASMVIAILWSLLFA